MVDWKILCDDSIDEEQFLSVQKEETARTHEERARMNLLTKGLIELYEHLGTEVDFGFITSKDAEKIVRCIRVIQRIYKSESGEEMLKRVNERNAARIAKRLGAKLVCIESKNEVNR